jgi:hypothetical protein
MTARKTKASTEANSPVPAYNPNMALGILAMHILEVMFFVGMAGSAVVVVISFIEDAQELFGED